STAPPFAPRAAPFPVEAPLASSSLAAPFPRRRWRNRSSMATRLPRESPASTTGPRAVSSSKSGSTLATQSSKRSGARSAGDVPCPASSGAWAAKPREAAALQTTAASRGTPQKPWIARTVGVRPGTWIGAGSGAPIRPPRRYVIRSATSRRAAHFPEARFPEACSPRARPSAGQPPTGRAPGEASVIPRAPLVRERDRRGPGAGPRWRRALGEASLLPPLDLVAADLLVEVGALDAEDDGGACDVPVELPQGLEDVAALGHLPVLAEGRALALGAARRQGRRRRGLLHLLVEGARVGVLRQIGDGDLLTAEDGRPLHDVLELPHVAGPAPSLQGL